MANLWMLLASAIPIFVLTESSPYVGLITRFEKENLRNWGQFAKSEDNSDEGGWWGRDNNSRDLDDYRGSNRNHEHFNSRQNGGQRSRNDHDHSSSNTQTYPSTNSRSRGSSHSVYNFYSDDDEKPIWTS